MNTLYLISTTRGDYWTQTASLVHAEEGLRRGRRVIEVVTDPISVTATELGLGPE